MTEQASSLISRIVCSVTSTPSVSAELKCAIIVAGQFDATLDVLQIRDAAEGMQLKYISFADHAKRLMRSLDSYQKFDQIVQAAGASIRVATHSAEGPAITAILQHAERTASNLVILNSAQVLNLRGQLPSNIGRIVGEIAGCALLTVRSGDAAPVLDQILLPVDFSEVTPIAVEWAAAFAQRFESTIQLLHVVPRADLGIVNANETGASVPLTQNASVGERLGYLEEGLRSRGLHVASSVLAHDNAASGILSEYERGGYGLVVMGMTSTAPAERRSHEGVISRVRQNQSVSVLSVGHVVPDSEFARGDHGEQEENSRVTSVGATG